jgi:hypothetical protein
MVERLFNNQFDDEDYSDYNSEEVRNKLFEDGDEGMAG